MICRKPDVDLDGIYNQTEAAKALHVERHTVRRYELDGLLKFRVRKAGRCKVTTGAEIIRCWKGMYL